jgi:hypothetical protein
MRLVKLERGPNWVRATYSAAGPNLQQIPKESKRDRRKRKAAL